VLDKEKVLIGYSGHGFVVADSSIKNGLNLLHYTDLTESILNPFKLNYLGFEGNEKFVGWEKDYEFILGIGDNKLRKKIGDLIVSKGKNVINVIDNSSNLSKIINLGIGVFINKNVCVNVLSEIGDYVILNSGCIIEHECKIGKASHIAPGAVLAGNVSIGENTFIGANSVVRQGIKIGNNVIIGAGSVIVKDVEDFEKIIGNPGKIMGQKS
jgi:sugar O-acyltransferase (sialic acid O-acetyltransferase NeuD family)